ncbi:MAG: hypothetical protein WDM92_06645 [Caulobacteraceae bacterium]
MILCEEDFRLGGRLLSDRAEIDAKPAAVWAAEAERDLRAMDNVTVMPRGAVFGVYDGGTYAALERVGDHLIVPAPHQPRQRLWRIVAKSAVVATGTLRAPHRLRRQRPAGVMLASAARTYLNRFAAAPARRMCVFTTTDDGWSTVADLQAAGVHVEAVIDPRPEVSETLLSLAEWAGTEVYLGGHVVGVSGGAGVTGLEIALDGTTTTRVRTDGLAVSGGFNPALGLTSHLGSRPQWLEEVAAFVPGEMPPGMSVAGSVWGRFGLGRVLADGAAAGGAGGRGPGLRGAAPARAPGA